MRNPGLMIHSSKCGVIISKTTNDISTSKIMTIDIMTLTTWDLENDIDIMTLTSWSWHHDIDIMTLTSKHQNIKTSWQQWLHDMSKHFAQSSVALCLFWFVLVLKASPKKIVKLAINYVLFCSCSAYLHLHGHLESSSASSHSTSRYIIAKNNKW